MNTVIELTIKVGAATVVGAPERLVEEGLFWLPKPKDRTLEDHLEVQRDGRTVTVEVTAGGQGLVSHSGSALLAQVADKSGLTQALSVRLAGRKQRRSGHDRGRSSATALTRGWRLLCL